MKEVVSTERIGRNSDFVGLQTRLLVGGRALNPNARNLPFVTVESLGNFAQRDYSPFNQASTRERQKFWQSRENDEFARQKESWINQVVSVFQNNQSFFQETEKGRRITGILSAFQIDSQQFTASDAQSLFNKYCNTGSNIKQFVTDIINIPDLEENLPAIQWLAGILGRTSAEIVKHLVDAEVKLQTQPDELVENVNADQKINHLNQEEKRLLEFLTEVEETEPESLPFRPQQQSLSEGYEWQKERAQPRTREEYEQEVAMIQNPATIAAYLMSRYPEYEDWDIQALAEEINRENQELLHKLDRANMGGEKLTALVSGVVEHYRDFIQSTYKITLPQIESLRIFPISGLISKAYNPAQADAFVRAGIPMIFLDMDQLVQVAFARGRNQYVIGKEEFEQHFRELLAGTIVHEFTHLAADHVVTKLSQVRPDGSAEEVFRGNEKIGLQFNKYFIENEEEHRIGHQERGRQLNEAVTEKLVEKWAHTYPYKSVDTSAYITERIVLNRLIDLIADEQNITEDEAFALFVRAHFTKEGLMPLVRTLSGSDYQRQNFLSTVYALMGYEDGKRTQARQVISYPLTLGFIDGSLNPHQIQEIYEKIEDLNLSPAAMQNLAKTIIASLPQAA